MMMSGWLKINIPDPFTVGLMVLLTCGTALAAKKNKYSNTFAHGGYYAGDVDISFGTKRTVDAQNFDKGQAIGVAKFCGRVRTGGKEPAALNAMTSSPASAHNLNGPGGPAGRVSSLTFLSPGAQGKASTGKFCLYKDAAGGFWSLERAAVGSKADDSSSGIKPCALNDQFRPDKGCTPSIKTASDTLPDWKIIRGTLLGMLIDNGTCYAGLITRKGTKKIEPAPVAFCQRTDLVGKKIQLVLRPGRIRAASCRARRKCQKFNKVMLIKSAIILKTRAPKAKAKPKNGVCKNSGACKQFGIASDYQNCLTKLAEDQNAELDKLYNQVITSLKKHDKLSGRSQNRVLPKFRIAQINWQSFRDSACDAEFWMARETITGGENISNCLCNLSYHRKLDLKRMLSEYGDYQSQ